MQALKAVGYHLIFTFTINNIILVYKLYHGVSFIKNYVSLNKRPCSQTPGCLLVLLAIAELLVNACCRFNPPDANP